MSGIISRRLGRRTVHRHDDNRSDAGTGAKHAYEAIIQLADAGLALLLP